MGSAFTELVRHEVRRPRFGERPSGCYSPFYFPPLSGRRNDAENGEIVEGPDLVIGCKAEDGSPKRFLKRCASGHNDSYRNRSLGMQPFEVLQVSIKKRVFVVPFDFENQGAVLIRLDVIDFMAGRLSLDLVHNFPDDEVLLHPSSFSEGPPHPLSAGCLASSRTNNFPYRNRRFGQNGLDFAKCRREIDR